MTTTSTATNTASALPELVFADGERIALAGFLAGYRALTRDAYALDLRQFVGWCERHGLKLFAARRADIELYARYLEEAGRARATVARRLCTVAGFYRYASVWAAESPAGRDRAIRTAPSTSWWQTVQLYTHCWRYRPMLWPFFQAWRARAKCRSVCTSPSSPAPVPV